MSASSRTEYRSNRMALALRKVEDDAASSMSSTFFWEIIMTDIDGRPPTISSSKRVSW